MQHPACPMGADVCAWQCTLDLINKATPGTPWGVVAYVHVRTCVYVCVGGGFIGVMRCFHGKTPSETS